VFVIYPLLSLDIHEGGMPGGDTIAIEKQEIDAMGNVRHRTILKLLDFCYNNDNSLIFLYEFMPNGSLANKYHKNSSFISINILQGTRNHILQGTRNPRIVENRVSSFKKYWELPFSSWFSYSYINFMS
jgi:serine/threonine protein kinase